MADLTQHTPLPTVQAIYKAYEAARGPAHRLHLGGSQIGHYCERYLWYQFHWAGHEDHDGRKLRLFDSGNHQEPRIVADLRSIGATVYDTDPSTNRQITYTAFGGHFQISLDGAVQGIPESSKWHALEMKTANDRSFNSTKKHGVEKDKPQHYIQMQVGMHLSGMTRALYIVVNKNTDEIYAERVRYSAKSAEWAMNRAERVIFSDEPPPRISEDPTWWQCKMCPMHDICMRGANAEINCRTCLHSTARRDGTWYCEKCERVLDEETQREGCGDHHLYRPALVGIGTATDAGDDYVVYDDAWRNGPWGEHSYTSREIRHADKLPLPDDMEQLRLKMGAELQELSHD